MREKTSYQRGLDAEELQQPQIQAVIRKQNRKRRQESFMQSLNFVDHLLDLGEIFFYVVPVVLILLFFGELTLAFFVLIGGLIFFLILTMIDKWVNISLKSVRKRSVRMLKRTKSRNS